MKKLYGIDFSNGKNGGMPAFCAMAAGVAAFLCMLFLLEEDEALLPGIMICAAVSVILAGCSIALFLKKRRRK